MSAPIALMSATASTRGEKNSSTIAQNGALYEKTPTRTRQGKRCGPNFPDGCRFPVTERGSTSVQ
jgi:hypothetical protein